MMWALLKREDVKPAELYELARQHRLVSRNLADAIPRFRALATRVDWYVLSTEDGEEVANVLVDVAEGEQADVDFIPTPKFFKGDEYTAPLRAAISPVMASLFNGNGGVRRVNAQVPHSRVRTKRALLALGFKHEGRIRCGVQYFGAKAPEDVHILGLLAGDIPEDE